MGEKVRSYQHYLSFMDSARMMEQKLDGLLRTCRDVMSSDRLVRVLEVGGCGGLRRERASTRSFTRHRRRNRSGGMLTVLHVLCVSGAAADRQHHERLQRLVDRHRAGLQDRLALPGQSQAQITEAMTCLNDGEHVRVVACRWC